MLNQHVLVLNKYWIAVHVCTVRRALTLLFQELARVVNDDMETYDFESWRELSEFANGNHRFIHTPNFHMMLPRVIVLSRYQKCPPRSVKFNRRNIFVRDRHTCQYCGRMPREDDLTIDHIIPRSRGGSSVWENVALACTSCNTRKGNSLPAECGMALIRPPRKPSWIASFQNVHLDDDNRSLWQKFIDTAYWETKLYE